MTMDFLERLVYLLDAQKFYSTVLSPVLGTGNSIAVTTLPSRTFQHYMDGSYNQGYAFQISIKHEQQLTALNTCQLIVDFLKDIKSIPSENNSYEFEGIDIQTSPNLLMKDDKYYIFTAQLSANLLVYKGD